MFWFWADAGGGAQLPDANILPKRAQSSGPIEWKG